VTNHDAFSVPQQKMVDVLLSCDLLSYAGAGTNVAVFSSDLDVLPAVALASATTTALLTVIRSPADSAGLYESELDGIGVNLVDWDQP
jgi:hypothetical protein